MTESKRAESAEVKKCILKANQGSNKVDLSTGLARIEYRESILQETIDVGVVFADTGQSVGTGENAKGVIEGLPICGGEELDLEMIDNYGEKLAVKVHVNKSAGLTGSTTKNIVALDLTSKEYFLNEVTRVVKRYDGYISDSVAKIMREIIQTNKSVFFDTTLNKYNFIGNSRKPFYLCMWLCKKSIPKIESSNTNAKTTGASNKNPTAGYFFYETSKGFYFKSIDKLLDASGKNPPKYIFNNTTDLPNGYFGKIVDYVVVAASEDDTGGMDIQSKLQMGAYGNRTRTLNTYSHEYKDQEKKASEQEKKVKTAGKELQCLPDWLKDKVSREFVSTLPVGVLPEGKTVEEQLKKSKEATMDVESTIAQAPMRYNQLYARKIEITIPGNFALHAGDLIYCDFPEQSAKDKQQVSTKLSGTYLISDICHQITPGSTYTKLNIVREGDGKKGGSSGSGGITSIL
jgi:hypothetical protein